MKPILFPNLRNFPRGQGRPSGFALVVTLSLMILLTIIGVGLLTLSSIALRASQQASDMATARSNARMAMMLAIGDLQKYMGPDQRVSANAELTFPPLPGPMPGSLRSKNMKWMGVWATTQPSDPSKPLSSTNLPDPAKLVVTGSADSAYSDKNFLSDWRNVAGYTQKSLMLAWLVSGDPRTAANPTVGTTAAPHATMVEKSAGLASATAADTNRDWVSAPLVTINLANNQKGGYAYWVGDESLKARIDQKPSDKQPNVTSAGDGGMARLAGAEGPNFRKVKAGTLKPYDPIQDAQATERSKLVSTNNLGIPLYATNKDAQKKNIHDITVYSESVLADARDGGLKKDLTSYINQTGNTPPTSITGIPETGLPEVGGKPGRAMLPGPLYATYGPNFLQLRNWYNLRKTVTGNLGAGKMSPVFLPTRTSTANPSFGPMPDLKSRAQAIQPYMTSCKMAYDFSIDTGRGNGLAVRLHVYPRVTLWNPYSVTITGGKYMVGFLKVVSGMATSGSQAGVISGTTGDFYGDATGNMIYFTLNTGDMAPGECVVLSPSGSTESTKYDVTNVANNVLSPATPSGGLSNFYFDSYRQVSAGLGQPYSIFTGEIRQFVLKSGSVSAAPVAGAAAPSLPQAPSPDVWSNLLYAITTGENRQSLMKGAGTYPYLASQGGAPVPDSPPADDSRNLLYAVAAGGPRSFAMKSDPGISSVEAIQAAAADTLPIIQRLSINSCGEWGNNYAGSMHGNWKGSEASRLLKEASAHVGTVPSRHWSTEARMQWLDECTGEVIGGYQGNHVGNFTIRKPIIANFNLRTNIVHRSNFCTAFEQWYWNYGAYLESVAEQKPLNDPGFSGAFFNGKSYGSPFGYPSDYSAVKNFVMFDVPQNETPVFSLACFQHAQLGYQGWQPTYVIGNSMCEPRSGSGPYNGGNPTSPYLYRDITVHQAHYSLGYASGGWGGGDTTYKNAWDPGLEIDRNTGWGRWDDLIQGTGSAMTEMLFYDSSYTTNYTLWDRYFLSSIPFTTGGTMTWTDATTSLPNTRMVLNPYCPNSPSERTSLMTKPNTLDYAGYFLMNQGAFNINSTNVEAWRAFFSTMNDVKRPTQNGETITGVFSRLLIPNTKNPKGNHFASGTWNGARTLTDTEIDTLAQEMVRIVRTRGPFLGLADFVNRRLLKVKGEITKLPDFKTDPSLCGPLQAAIEAAGINSTLQDASITTPVLGSLAVRGGDSIYETTGYPYLPGPDAARGGWSFDNRALDPDYWSFAPWKAFGAPGYLTQADVLQTIGPNITARGDTFVVRGYGEARDASGKVVTARVWCEAVVQRTPDYVVGKSITAPSGTDGNNPLEPLLLHGATDYSVSLNPAINPVNKTFGRRFVIKQFRWLNPSEV